MRKKTDNEDLAKRAKRLVKKWQKLVSNHFKNLAKAIELSGNGNSGKSTPTSQINGVIREQEERPKSCTEIPTKKGIKRRRTSVSAESSPLSDKDVAKSNNSKKVNNDGSLKEVNILLNDESSCESAKSFQNGQHNALGIQVNVHNSSPTDCMLTENNMLKKENSAPEAIKCQNGNNGKQEDDWIAVPECTSSKQESVVLSNSAVAVEPPCDIPEESLSVERKQLPEDCFDLVAEADGINGCYDKDGTWCSWSESVSQNSHSLSILPYVMLE